MPIEFPRPSPIPQIDLEALAVLDDQIETRQAMKRRLADAMLDRLASGASAEGCLTVKREVLKLADGVTEERLVIGGYVRYKRLTGSATVLRRGTAE